MERLPLRYRLLVVLPQFTWPYLSILLALAGADIHFDLTGQRGSFAGSKRR